MMRKLAMTSPYNRRIRLSSRGIALAVLVTVAAVSFAIAAHRVTSTAPHAASFGHVERDGAADHVAPAVRRVSDR